jgi:nucleoid-associated protein YgaU
MEPLEPYEPQTTSYDWDPEEEETEPETTNVLWGRLAFFGLTLLLAFVIGRMSAPNGIPASDLKVANDRLAALETENDDLTTQLADAQAAAEAPTDTTTDTTPTDETTPDASGNGTEFTGEEYVVQSGDSLNTIAEKFYGDTAYGDYLAEVNNISDPAALSIGTTLIIPDESELPAKSEL